MLSILRDRLTYANITATLALFIALTGGVAWALEANSVRSGHIVNDQVKSIDVRNDNLAGGGLGASDLRPDSVGASEIASDAVSNSELAADAVSSGEIGPNAVSTGEVVNDSLTGDDVSGLGSADITDGALGSAEVEDNSLLGIDIAESSLGVSSSAKDDVNGLCNPSELGAYVDCASVQLTTAGASEALVIATGGFHGSASGVDAGECFIEHNGTAQGQAQELGILGNEHSSDNLPDGFSIVHAQSLGAGSHTFSLACDESSGDIGFDDTRIAVLAVQ